VVIFQIDEDEQQEKRSPNAKDGGNYKWEERLSDP